VVELNLFHFETATPLGLISQAVLERALGVLLTDEELNRFRVVKLVSAYSRIAWNRIPLPVAKQPFQGLDTGVSVAVPKIGES
jgi:hypothetical protein